MSGLALRLRPLQRVPCANLLIESSIQEQNIATLHRSLRLRISASCAAKSIQHGTQERFHTAWTRCCHWQPSAFGKHAQLCTSNLMLRRIT